MNNLWEKEDNVMMVRIFFLAFMDKCKKTYEGRQAE